MERRFFEVPECSRIRAPIFFIYLPEKELISSGNKKLNTYFFVK